MMLVTESPRLHLRIAGRSEDLDFAMLNLQPSASDADLREAIARHLDCALAELADYVIVREAQAVIVRPFAFYG